MPPQPWPRCMLLGICIALLVPCASPQPEVRVGVLWDSQDASEVQDVHVAVQVAIDIFTRSSNMSWQPVMLPVAVGQGGSEALVDGVCELVRQGGLVGVVGMQTSDGALHASFQAGLHHLPVISPSATVSHLDKDGLFLRRTVPDNRAAAQSMPSFLKEIPALSKASLGIVFSKDYYGTDMAYELRNAMNEAGRTVATVFEIPSPANYTEVFAHLRSKYVEVVILATSHSVGMDLLQAAVKGTPSAFTGGYAWIMMDAMSFDDIADNDLRKQLVGLLGVRPLLETSQRYFELGAARGGHPSDLMRLTFDATWALLLAAERSQVWQNPLGPKQCEEISAGAEWPDGQKMLDALDGIDEAGGAAGTVQVKPSTQSEKFELVNYQVTLGGATRWASAGVFSPPATAVVAPEDTISWPGHRAPSSEQLLLGRHLRILFIIFPPFVQARDPAEVQAGELAVEGLVVDIIQDLSAKLDFTFEAVSMKGNWAGGLKRVAAGEFDMQAADTGITEEREKFVDFTQPYMETTSILVVSSAVYESNMFRFASPFTIELWIVLFGIVLATSVALYLLEDRTTIKPVEDRGGMSPYVAPSGKYSYENSLWFACTAFLNVQTGEALTRTGRLFSLGFFWLSVVTIATYTAELAAFLARRTPAYKVNSIDEFTSGSFGASQLGVTPDTVNEKWLKAQTGLQGDYYTSNSEFDQTEKTKSGQLTASIQDSTWAEWYVGRADSSGVCPFEVRGAGWNPRGVGLALQKNSPYTSVLSEQLLSLRESGRLDALKSKWYAPNCTATEEADQSLVIEDFGGALLVYGGMVVVAVAARLIRICRARLCPPRRPHATTDTSYAPLGSDGAAPPFAPPAAASPGPASNPYDAYPAGKGSTAPEVLSSLPVVGVAQRHGRVQQQQQAPWQSSPDARKGGEVQASARLVNGAGGGVGAALRKERPLPDTVASPLRPPAAAAGGGGGGGDRQPYTPAGSGIHTLPAMSGYRVTQPGYPV